MAETAALTKETVAEARAQLIARDRKPSQRAIIKLLGRGSFSQVGPWLRELDAEDGERAGSTLVEPLSDAVSQATAELWRALGAEADRVVEDARQGFEKRSRMAEGERDRAQASLERLRQELQSAQGLGETQRQALETQQEELDQLRAAHAMETAAHAETRGRAEGLAVLAAERQATLEQLQREQDETRRAWTAEREASAAELAALTDAYEQRLAERDQRIETHRRELAQSRLAVARLETSVERLDAQHREREAHQVEWQTRHQSLVDAHAELQARFAGLGEAKSAADQALMSAGEGHAQRLADKERLIDRLEIELVQRNAALQDASKEKPDTFSERS
ncbi:MAG: DNA-binding protein [Sulfitobacter sp.]